MYDGSIKSGQGQTEAGQSCSGCVFLRQTFGKNPTPKFPHCIATSEALGAGQVIPCADRVPVERFPVDEQFRAWFRENCSQCQLFRGDRRVGDALKCQCSRFRENVEPILSGDNFGLRDLIRLNCPLFKSIHLSPSAAARVAKLRVLDSDAYFPKELSEGCSPPPLHGKA